MTQLIVPDVHEQIRLLKKILEKYGYVDEVVFLGDFFDTFLGLTAETLETVLWIRDNVTNPKYKFLMGNHDLQYRCPIDQVRCSGYNRNKQQLVSDHLTKFHWQPFKLHYWAEGWLCSHAGYHPALLHPMNGFSKKALVESEEHAFYLLTYCQTIDPLFLPGRSRGGTARRGGVIWLDFNDEFIPVAGLNQIVGHTKGMTVRLKSNGDPDYDAFLPNQTVVRSRPDEKEVFDSVNYCIDTNMLNVALVEDGNLTIVPVEIPVIYRVKKHRYRYVVEGSYDDGATWNVFANPSNTKNLLEFLNAENAKDYVTIVNTFEFVFRDKSIVASANVHMSNHELRTVIAASIWVIEECSGYIAPSKNAAVNTQIKVRDYLVANKKIEFDPDYWQLADEVICFFSQLDKLPVYDNVLKRSDSAEFFGCMNMSKSAAEVTTTTFPYAVMMPYLYAKLNLKEPVRLDLSTSEAKLYKPGDHLGTINQTEKFFMKLVGIGLEDRSNGGNVFLIEDRHGNSAIFYSRAEDWCGLIQLGDCFALYAVPQRHSKGKNGGTLTLFRNVEFVGDVRQSANLPPISADKTGLFVTKR